MMQSGMAIIDICSLAQQPCHLRNGAVFGGLEQFQTSLLFRGARVIQQALITGTVPRQVVRLVFGSIVGVVRSIPHGREYFLQLLRRFGLQYESVHVRFHLAFSDERAVDQLHFGNHSNSLTGNARVAQPVKSLKKYTIRHLCNRMHATRYVPLLRVPFALGPRKQHSCQSRLGLLD